MEDVKETEVQEPEKTEDSKGEEKKAEEPKTEDKKEEAKPEKKGESEEAKVDISALKSELAEANKKAMEVDALSTKVDSLSAEVKEKDSVIKEYEELLDGMVKTKMENVPSDLKDLIPENMSLKQKLSWLEKAESKGIFNKESKKKPSVEIGKPMNVETPAVDTSKLTATQKMAMAYSNTKK